MNDWNEDERAQRQANVLDARTLQASSEVIDYNFNQLVRAGPQNIVKVTDPGPIQAAVAGYVTLSQAIAGKTPQELNRLLGLRPGDLWGGAAIYRLKRLPAKSQIEPRGYTTLPDGAALPPGRIADEAGYSAGLGAWQVRLTAPVDAEYLGLLNPGVPFSLAVLGKPANLSGGAWWHANEAKYPNIADINGLTPLFASQVAKFISAMRNAGARVVVSATRRNAVRAHLMYTCFMIAKGKMRAVDAPRIDGCDIVWVHGSEEQSRTAAEEMRALFHVVYEPSLKSLHITGQAIDMTIDWSTSISVADALGKKHTLAGPDKGSTCLALHRIGATYGVNKLIRDAPHWSVNGH